MSWKLKDILRGFYRSTSCRGFIWAVAMLAVVQLCRLLAVRASFLPPPALVASAWRWLFPLPTVATRGSVDESQHHERCMFRVMV
jgi:hypothetical protein